jgi:extracellular factor (EF) 3-hydroxypalmitic acid methyl ester biosynthesis protein
MSTAPRIRSPRLRSPRLRISEDLETRSAIDEFYNTFLADVYEKLLHSKQHHSPIGEVMEDLFLSLSELRQQASPEDWTALVEKCRRHPACALLHEDPFTFRAYSKPRGYAGDAVLMDYIYSREEMWELPPASELGARMFDFTTSAPASEGVRARRGFVADLLDNLVADQGRMRVLSVAAGHLREAAISAAVRRRRFERFVALDADATSLEEIKRSYGKFGVETILARVGRLIDSRLSLGQFDLIYSLGLFDYLQQRLGQRIVARLFDMLRPGGRVLVANFLPSVRDIGYMEAFMDWHLIYRTRQEMIDLIDELPQSKIKNVQLFAEENQNIIFVMVTRS